MKLSLLLFLLLSAAGGELSQEENRQLDNLVAENVVFEFDEIISEGTSGVVDASLIEVKLFQLFDKNCKSKEECGYVTYSVLKSGELLEELADSSDLLPFISPDFKIKSETDAREFEKMLNTLLPVFFASGEDVYQEGNTWVFVREESFGELKGVFVQVDDDGGILKIEDADEIVKNGLSGESGEVQR